MDAGRVAGDLNVWIVEDSVIGRKSASPQLHPSTVPFARHFVILLVGSFVQQVSLTCGEPRGVSVDGGSRVMISSHGFRGSLMVTCTSSLLDGFEDDQNARNQDQGSGYA